MGEPKLGYTQTLAIELFTYWPQTPLVLSLNSQLASLCYTKFSKYDLCFSDCLLSKDAACHQDKVNSSEN